MFHWKSFQGYVGYNLISSSRKNSVPHPPTIVEDTPMRLLPVMLVGIGLLPPRKQIPHRNWLETTTIQLETPENNQFCFPESGAFCMKFWIASNFSALDIYYISHNITLYTCSFSAYVFFKYIYNIILGYRCLRLAGYIPELECRSVTAEQVLQIKNYAVPQPWIRQKRIGFVFCLV